MNTTATQIADADKIAILKLLADGRDFGFARAANMHLTEEQIRQIAQSHGYPDKAKMAWAVDEIRKHVDARALGNLPPPTVTALPQGAPRSPAAPVQTDRFETFQGKGQRPAFDATADLLLKAASHPRVRVQQLGKKVSDQLAQLRDAMARAEADEKAKRAGAERRAAEKRSRERAKQQMREEVKRLEADLKAARQKLRGSRAISSIKSAADGGMSESAKIRAWCADNNVEVGANGRIPAHVRELYDAAHHEAQAS